MDNLSVLRGPYMQNFGNNTMASKKIKSKQKEVVLSTSELSKFGMGVKSKALQMVNSAKKSKIIIRLEKQ